MAVSFTVDKSPEEKYSLQSRAVVQCSFKKYGKVIIPGRVEEIYITMETSPKIGSGKIGLSSTQREWLNVRHGAPLQVVPQDIPRQQNLIGTISIEIDYYQKLKKAQPAINSDDLASYFLDEFSTNVFCSRQGFLIGFLKPLLLKAEVINITAEIGLVKDKGRSKSVPFGIIHANTRVIFEKKQDSTLQLIGRHIGDSAHEDLFSPDWDFNEMGIGGLDNEFSDIFRRAFASRVFPPDVVEQMGMKHVRGILLFGPPGTGKTLMARQIGKMLHAREPKIINGPEILNKYVGESEANVRALFAEAEAEQKKMGFSSALHIIIFDEIDAICKVRGSLSGSTGVNDTVVNQLLAKIDGVEQLNNILLIGMTNRKDMIDEALLRPGRLEVQMEIGLPDESGRVDILKIHTSRMRNNKKLSDDVDIESLAKRTKNFSGAEIEGLVRSAQATAMNKLIQAKQNQDKISVTHEEADRLQITMKDFEHALSFDLKPAFGISDKQLDSYLYNDIILWGPRVQELLYHGKESVGVASASHRTPLVSLLLHGDPGCGKTALAAHIAKTSDFPFVKVLSPENMIGFNEGAKCSAIKKVFEDAYKSELSCVVIDDIERLLDYVAIGPRFSNLVLQAILVLLRKIPPMTTGKSPHKLLIIGTTGLSDEVLELTGIKAAFNSHLSVPYLTRGEEILAVLEEPSMYSFSQEELASFRGRLKGKSCFVGIKKLISIIESAQQSGDKSEALVRILQLEAKLN